MADIVPLAGFMQDAVFLRQTFIGNDEVFVVEDTVVNIINRLAKWGYLLDEEGTQFHPDGVHILICSDGNFVLFALPVGAKQERYHYASIDLPDEVLDLIDLEIPD